MVYWVKQTSVLFKQSQNHSYIGKYGEKSEKLPQKSSGEDFELDIIDEKIYINEVDQWQLSTEDQIEMNNIQSDMAAYLKEHDLTKD